MGMPPPTMATAGNIPTRMSPTCIEPPLPLQHPVALANSSAMIARGSNSFGNRVAVRPVRARQIVGRSQLRADPCRDRFLADVEV